MKDLRSFSHRSRTAQMGLARSDYLGKPVADLMAGHVNMLFASILETSGYVKAGKLRALAVTSPQRSPGHARRADLGRTRRAERRVGFELQKVIDADKARYAKVVAVP